MNKAKSKKKYVRKTIIAVLVASALLLVGCFGKKDVTSGSERVVELLNQIQFTTCKIINSKNKGLLESEFDDILNNIEPSSLEDDELISEYGRLLNTLTELKLSQNQRARVEERSKEKRKNAIFSAFNSFGSVLVPSSNPYTLGISLAYVALNATFNYARTVNEIKIEERDEEFEISQAELRNIDSQRTSLFTTAGQIFSSAKYKSSGFIAEAEMKEFARLAYELETATNDSIIARNHPLLENMRENFSNFIPFWSILGQSYQKLGDSKSAKAAFKKVEELSRKSRIFKTNPYQRDSSKQMIAILLKEKAGRSEIEKQISLVEKNTLKTQVMQDDLQYFLCSVYIAIKEYGKANKCMAYLLERGLESKTDRMNCDLAVLTGNKNSTEYKQSEALVAYLDSKFGEYDKYLSVKCPFDVTYAYSITSGWFSDTKQELEIEKVSESGGYKVFKFPKLKWSDRKKTKMFVSGGNFGYIIGFDDTSVYIYNIGIRDSKNGKYEFYEVSPYGFAKVK